MSSGEIKVPFSKSLFWRISAIFMLLLILVGLIYMIIAISTARLYYQETNQRLNSGIAKQIVKSTKPFKKNGAVNQKALKNLFKYVMVINPAIEVYLLDQKGKILTYFAPKSKVKLDKIPLNPVKQFIQNKGDQFVKGVDPRQPEKKKVFSAAPIKASGEIKGYMYVILASEDYESAMNLLLDNYILRGGAMAFGATLVIAILTGLGLIWLIIRYTRKIIQHVNQFKEGNLQARIPVTSNDELGQLARAFNEMADRIENNIDQIKDMEHARRELIANVSHDLRTPMATLQGYTETLSMKGSQLAKDQKDRYLQIILQNTEKLKKLVDELFELSKLEARQVEPHKEPFFINELIQDITNKYQLTAQSSNVNIKPIISNDLPPVYADVSMIDRVIQNLIDNSLKFTPENGTITIELSKLDSSVEVKISDTGPGIKQEEQAMIFDRYRKFHNGSKHSYGSGLGLAIVKNMLEIQGYDIHLLSKPHQGSSFYFYLPFYE